MHRPPPTHAAGPVLGLSRLSIRLGMLALAVSLAGCEDEGSVPAPPVPEEVVVRVSGHVTDPAGSDVPDAGIRIHLHRTDDCASGVIVTAAERTDADGRYSAAPAVDPRFRSRRVCVDVQAEPPSDRPDLAPAESRGRTAEFRHPLGDEPLDEVEIDLTLPAADGG